MDNGKLPPIPTPISQRWREFRIQVLPFIIFAATIVAIVYLWRNVVQPAGIVGFVETNQVSIASLQDGLISELYVERFQIVKKDQPIGIVTATDPELIKATVEAAKAELRVLNEQTLVDIIRGRQNLQRLMNDLLEAKLERSAKVAELRYAETNVLSLELLVKQDIGPKLQLEAAIATRDSLREEIKGFDAFIVGLEKSLAEENLGAAEESVRKAVMEAVTWKEKELELTLKPATLKAPYDGMVMMVYHHAGEKVIRGEPILSLSTLSATNVIGYVRQPIQRHPQPGDAVQVTTRTTPRRTAPAVVTKVAAQLEPINPGLLSADTPRMEVGLPIVVTLPPNLGLLPGEFVDIAFAPTKNGQPAAQ